MVPFTLPRAYVSDRKCLPFSALQISLLDICKLLPHLLFVPLCHFSPVQIYLLVFTQKSVLEAFPFGGTPPPPSFNQEIQESGAS